MRNLEGQTPLDLIKIATTWAVRQNDVKLGKEIGAGSFASVYQASWLGADVAVKVIQCSDKSSACALLKETQLWGPIRNPRVVQFMGSCSVEDKVYIVMELMEGGTLYDVLHVERVRLPLASTVRIARDIATGICLLHNTSPYILHRDLKSGNILLDRTRSRAKITDFGLAYFLDRKIVEGGKRHMPRGVVGTLSWIAPEILAREPHTEKVDIYSFGMILYELIARKLPWGEDVSNYEMIKGLVTSGARPNIPVNCPEAISDLIKDCWKTRPEERPNAQEVVERLKAFAEMLDSVQKLRF